MILIFGPIGSGKSVQGKFLQARLDWIWLSAGQVLRDTKDQSIIDTQTQGVLVSNEIINPIIGEAIEKASRAKNIIVDGFPRDIEQAKYLVDNQPNFGYKIDLAIVLNIPEAEAKKRLVLRGRSDDNPQAIEERFNIYHHQTAEVIDYFQQQDVRIITIDGMGSFGQVHDRIMEELEKCQLA